MKIQEYQDFVATCFIEEPDPKYNLLRAGLELAEEYLEWYSCKIDREIDELGDIVFWCAQIANLLNFTLEVGTDLDYRGFDEIVRDILGKIKRVYRDGKKESLIDIQKLTNELFTKINEYSQENYEIEQVIQHNVEKLTRRSLNGTIQGAGDR